MLDLTTNYLGMTLRNPLIVASCSLTKSPDQVARCEANGAGAVVLKSLFEEQIQMEIQEIMDSAQSQWHPESYDYIRQTKMEFGEEEYLDIIRESKKGTSIPVIASINCFSAKGWTDYAKQIEMAGADAIELNIATMPTDPSQMASEVEQHYFAIVEEVKKRVTLPIAVKIGPYFSSLPNFAAGLTHRGISGLVFFNRFYQFDVNTESLQVTGGNRFSDSTETSLPLRWIALLAGRIKCDLASSTGIHETGDIIKHLLVGASAVQVCSSLYINGLSHLKTLTEGLTDWMLFHGFDSVDTFQGILSLRHSKHPEHFTRMQYIKALVNIE
ncbi:dihydroorotate dehydrogenase-like protein [bacterium]|nr:dihydroorotate dehydrogenase-like protein [candidate division CSSED10-310 bacterium]